MGRRGDGATRWMLPLLTLALLLNNCGRRDPLAEQRAALAAAAARLQGCLPQAPSASNASGRPRLAVVEITRQPQQVSVQLVALAGPEAMELSLPVYLLSRGRWLINERERAYLLDESCREYKLQDRKPVDGRPLPLDGKVSLKPGEAFAFKLNFQALPAEARLGALVYGSISLPFVLLTP